ncbi:hypothetical protein NX059_003903 [Plenodomus lindquistii]|nr:hypothetical protein NX059_003903 [Plenodomus lindquistii]
MAPQRSVPSAPPAGHRVVDSKVTKSKRKGTVRYFKNGLLYVGRKSGKYFKITQQNARKSPLLRLPAEIRNQIWDMVVGNNICDVRHGRWIDGAYESKSYQVSNFHASLPQTCRQIFAETSLLPYQLSDFFFDITEVVWINQLPKYAQHNIRRIHIEAEALYWMEFNGGAANDVVRAISTLLLGLKHVVVLVSDYSTLDYPDLETGSGQRGFKRSIEKLNRGIQVEFKNW